MSQYSIQQNTVQMSAQSDEDTSINSTAMILPTESSITQPSLDNLDRDEDDAPDEKINSSAFVLKLSYLASLKKDPTIFKIETQGVKKTHPAYQLYPKKIWKEGERWFFLLIKRRAQLSLRIDAAIKIREAAEKRADEICKKAEIAHLEAEQERREKEVAYSRAESADARAEQERREKEAVIACSLEMVLMTNDIVKTLNSNIERQLSTCGGNNFLMEKIACDTLFLQLVMPKVKIIAQQFCEEFELSDLEKIENLAVQLLGENNTYPLIAFVIQQGKNEAVSFSVSAVSTSAVSSAGFFPRPTNQAVASAASENQAFTVDQ